MADIHINHCVLRVVRRGGWSWGASRRELKDKVAHLLPELIATRLAALLSNEDADLMITSPVRLNVSLSRQQWLELIDQNGSSTTDGPAFQVLNQQVDKAIRQSVLPHVESQQGEPDRPAHSNDSTAMASKDLASTHSSLQPLLRLLLKWQQKGELGLFLRGLSLSTLEAWHAALVAINTVSHLRNFATAVDSERADDSLSGSDVDAVVAKIACFIDIQNGGFAAILLGRIVAAVEVVARWRIAPGDPQLQDSLNRHIPIVHGSKLDKRDADLQSARYLSAQIEQLHSRSDVDAFVRRLNDSDLPDFHEALTRSTSVLIPASRPADQDQVSANSIQSLVRHLSREAEFDKPDIATVLRCRIVVALMVIRDLRISSSDPSLRDALDKYLPLDSMAAIPPVAPMSPGDQATGRKERANGSSASSFQSKSSVERQSSPIDLPTLRGRGDVHVNSALPFLLLGPLSEMGYLETLEAALDSAGLSQLAPAFATALAYKISEPPQRGWLRTPENRNIAATFAGGVEPVPDSSLVHLAECADQFASALDAVIGLRVVAGAGDGPLFHLHRFDILGDPRFLLAEVDGLILCSCSESLEKVLAVLGTCDPGCILVEGNTATLELLSELHQRGFRFIVDVPPARDETWRGFKGTGGERWWTNDTASPLSRLLRFARQLPAAAESISETSEELFISRRAITGTGNQQLEDSLALATSVALGQLAWTLWRERELTEPLLTLQRFADLDARVRFDAETVRVVLPLGKRSADLADHRLLNDVVGVPWLDGRVLTFGKG